MTLNSTPSTQFDTLEFLAAKSPYQSLPTLTQIPMNQQQQSISTLSLPLGHSDNNNTTTTSSSSFIVGTNQKSKSVAAYISSPPPPPITTQLSSPPLATHVQIENPIMDDNSIFTIDNDTIDSTIMTGSENDSDNDSGIHSLAITDEKKSVRSRFNNALKNSKLRPRTKNRPPSNFNFLPSSSTPIPNSLAPLEKRHSTSSTLIKSNHRYSQQKQNTRPHSSHQKNKHNHDTSSPHHSPTSKTLPINSPQCATQPYEEKHSLNPTSSSSTSCITRHDALTCSQAPPSTDLMETTSHPLSTESETLPSVDPSTPPPPPSRFLAAFQKIYQQRTSQDHQSVSNNTATTIATTITTKRSMDVSPTASTIGTGSKSSSFTEKIKNRFKPTLGPSSKPSTCPTLETRKPTSVAATPRPSQSSTPSIINRSWSQFSRPFASSTSVKHASLHLPKQNESVEGQISSVNGKRPTVSSSRHHRNNRSKLLSQHQRFVQHPGLSSTPNLRGYNATSSPKASLTPLHHQYQRQQQPTGISPFGTDYVFDANTIREDTTLSTCSTLSQLSSSSSLSVTASSSTSASSSPTSLSMDGLPHDIKKPFDFTNNTNKLYAMSTTTQSTSRPPSIVFGIANTNKSAPPTTIDIPTRTNNSKRAPHLTSRSISGIGINNSKQINKSAGPPTKHRPPLNTNNNNNKKRHVRFVATAKVQDTFSKFDYDRASDPYAICTRLTAHLAQQIKDELNAFKLEEMLVHHQSRGNTQFFM